MIVTATKTMPALIHLPDDTPLTTKPPADRVASGLKKAAKAHRKAQRPEASDDDVKRANIGTDRAYTLPLTRLDHASLMVDLVLLSDGESLDEPLRKALKSVANVLAAAVRAAKQ